MEWREGQSKPMQRRMNIITTIHKAIRSDRILDDECVGFTHGHHHSGVRRHVACKVASCHEDVGRHINGNAGTPVG